MSVAGLPGLTRADLEALSTEDLLFLEWQMKWRKTARPNQILPKDGWTEAGFQAGRGFGKEICVETPIPTPNGWRRFGDLSEGDLVFDELGKPCSVLQVFDTMPTEAYRLVFSDGAELLAGAEHQWVTWTHAERKQYLRTNGSPTTFPANWAAYEGGGYGPKIRTTKQIVETLRFGKRGDTNHCIPTCGPLQYPAKDLPLDPWLLGYWLGNGHIRASTVTCHQDDVEFVRRRAEAAGFVNGDLYAVGITFSIKGLIQGLRAAGVADHKHVPKLYLQASEADRRAVLAGLLDSDGYCDPGNSHIEFCSIDEELARDVAELARSLSQKPVIGVGRATLNGKDCGPKYRVCWRPTFQPFLLPRKAAAWRAPASQALRNCHRMIVDAQPIPPRPMRCITVDSPNSMYLIGEDMIPTHNTRVGAEWLGAGAYRDPEALPSAVIAPTLNDVRFTCFEGHSGLLSVIPPELVKDYNKTNLQITLVNGATIRGFSAEEPERLRGPQVSRLWCDELAAWSDGGEDTWNMAMFGLRLGKNPQVVWTTTPKPKDLIRKLTAPKPGRLIIRGSTYENRANLAETFFEQLKQYEGTQLGRQELEGELIDGEEGGIISRSWFKLWPAKSKLPHFEWIVMSLDTAFTEKTLDKRTHTADSTACGVFGAFFHEDMMQVMLLDCWDAQIGMPDLIKRTKRELNVAYGDDDDQALIKPMFGSDKPMTSGRKPDILVIEDKGSGISLRQMLEREGIDAYKYNPGRADKLTRLHMVSHIAAKGMVWLPESDKYPGRPRTWVEPLLAQVCAFTGSGSIKHDDYVDVFSQALRLLIDKNFLTAVKREKKEYKDEYVPKKPVVNPYAI